MLTDVRGYLGLVRQVVFVARVQQAWSAHPLPLFEQPLLGGAASLRGFPLGYRMGDRLAAASAEVRMPITSPLRIARTGMAVFTDAGTVLLRGRDAWRHAHGTGAWAPGSSSRRRCSRCASTSRTASMPARALTSRSASRSELATANGDQAQLLSHPAHYGRA